MRSTSSRASRSTPARRYAIESLECRTLLSAATLVADINPGTFFNSSLDINASTVYITYAGPAADPISTIRTYLKSGYNAGLWNGTSNAIQSTAAAASPLVDSIGYADSADIGNPAGLPANTIELRYTVIGDTNLDGTVGLTDLAALLKSFNTGTNWDQGNLAFSATTSLTDLAALLKHFNNTVSSPAAIPAAIPMFSPDAAQNVGVATDDPIAQSTAETSLTPVISVKPATVPKTSRPPQARKHRAL